MALITNEDTSILPYNDDYMVYDLDRQLYVITEKGVLDLVGENLIEICGSKIEADLTRYEVSQDVYNYISSYSLFSSFKYKKWLIAKDSNLRDLFLRVLADQMRYYIRSGAGLLKDMHGIQIEKGKSLNLMNLRNQVLVSASVDMLLSKSGLLYTGKMYYSEYEDDGTW